MRKGILAAFVAALSIFAATVPSYARELLPLSVEGSNKIDAAGWYHDGTGWKCRAISPSFKYDDTWGWKLINGRFYHIDPETRYCDLNTTVMTKEKNLYGKLVDDGQASFDKTGALTENGVVVDLGRKEGEFTFLTCNLETTSDGKKIVNRNYAYEVEKEALNLGIRPTGEKCYMGEVSEDNYCGWVITGPGVNEEVSTVTFWDCTANSDTTLKKMREHPERTYELRLNAVDTRTMWIESVAKGPIPPTSSLVPAGYLPTP